MKHALEPCLMRLLKYKKLVLFEKVSHIIEALNN